MVVSVGMDMEEEASEKQEVGGRVYVRTRNERINGGLR